MDADRQIRTLPTGTWIVRRRQNLIGLVCAGRTVTHPLPSEYCGSTVRHVPWPALLSLIATPVMMIGMRLPLLPVDPERSAKSCDSFYSCSLQPP